MRFKTLTNLVLILLCACTGAELRRGQSYDVCRAPSSETLPLPLPNECEIALKKSEGPHDPTAASHTLGWPPRDWIRFFEEHVPRKDHPAVGPTRIIPAQEVTMNPADEAELYGRLPQR